MIKNYKHTLTANTLTLVLDLTTGEAGPDGVNVYAYNENSGSHAIKLGGPNLTTANGMDIYPHAVPLNLKLDTNEKLYAISTDTSDLRLLVSGLIDE